jgi:DNA-binding transcriptional MerR regulator
VNARYRIQKFAGLTGATVKALLHYDRIGLLRPPRTASGHRLYTDRDRQRLDQIVALKFLGIPLKQVRTVLAGQTQPLAGALRAQRQALTAGRDRLDQAIHAIQRAEAAIADGRGSDAALLRELTASIVGGEADSVRHYFSDAAWAVSRHHFEEHQPEAWRRFYDDAYAARHEDPSGERAEALLWRMYVLLNEETGSDARLQREAREGFTRAWFDRDRWPPAVRQRVDAPRMREIRAFLHRVSQMMFLKYGPDFYSQHMRGARAVA